MAKHCKAEFKQEIIGLVVAKDYLIKAQKKP